MYRNLLNIILLSVSFCLFAQFYIDRVKAANPAAGGAEPATAETATAETGTQTEEPAAEEKKEEPAGDKKDEGTGLGSMFGMGSSGSSGSSGSTGDEAGASGDSEKSFWEKYGTYIMIGLAVVVVLVIIGVVMGFLKKN